MTDLVEFLRARLDEDEAAARSAEHVDGAETLHWSVAGRRHHRFDNGCSESYVAVRTGGWDRILVARDGALDEVSQHIARHDPAHVLVDVEAKRFLMDWGIAGIDRGGLSPVMGHNILAGLALSYADHPDYDESWRP